MEIHLSSSTKIIIALCFYVTIFTLILFLSWFSKQKIKSRCAYITLAFLGTVLVLGVGFSGLALQIYSENQSECGQYNKKYLVGMKYAYCQVHHVNKYLNKTMPNMEAMMHKWIKHTQTYKPKECKKVTTHVNLNSCPKRGDAAPITADELDLQKFQELGKLPLCHRKDSLIVCAAKKVKLRNQVADALHVDS